MLPKIQFSILVALYVLLQLCVADNLISNEEVTTEITSPDIFLHFGFHRSGNYDIKELYYDSRKTSLTLCCITEGYDIPLLNWYVGNDRQKTEERVSTYARTSILQLRDLSEKENGKIFSCREEKDGGAILSVRLAYKKDEQGQNKHEPNAVILVTDDIVQDNSGLLVSGSLTAESVVEEVTAEITFPDILFAFDDNHLGDYDIKELSYGSQNSSLNLVCIAQGYNTPSLKWYLGNDQQKTEDHVSTYARTSILQLRDLSEKDNGKTFSCREERDGGSIQSVQLVYKKDEEYKDGPEVTILVNGDIVQDNSRLNVSGSVTLDCIVQGYNPPSVGWYVDSMALSTTNQKSTYSASSSFQIKNIPLAQDSSKFSCGLNGQESWAKSVTVFTSAQV